MHVAFRLLVAAAFLVRDSAALSPQSLFRSPTTALARGGVRPGRAVETTAATADAPPSAAALQTELESLCAGSANGVRADDARRAAVEAAAAALAGGGGGVAEAAARVPLTGTWDLLFCTAPGGSSGKLGPLVGAVQQIFVDETRFVNAVTLGGEVFEFRATASRDDRFISGGRREEQHPTFTAHRTVVAMRGGRRWEECANPRFAAHLELRRKRPRASVTSVAHTAAPWERTCSASRSRRSEKCSTTHVSA